LDDISFDSHGKTIFPTKHHGDVSLSKAKWEIICAEPERFYYRYNIGKIATTLINPDHVRHHKVQDGQFIYYKKFDTFNLAKNVEGPVSCKYFAIVIDQKTGRICTIYPVLKPKSGMEYKS